MIVDRCAAQCTSRKRLGQVLRDGSATLLSDRCAVLRLGQSQRDTLTSDRGEQT